MTEKDIDAICWWIPFKKTRHSVRNVLTAIFLIKEELKEFHCEANTRTKEFKELQNRFDAVYHWTNRINFATNDIFNKAIMNLFRQNSFKIQNGVFEGMNYIEDSNGSALFPKLLGSYEEQIYSWINEIESKNYDVILDIGCAEGYYAVGFAYKGYAKKVIAYDINPDAINNIKKLSSINNLKSEIVIENKICDAKEIERVFHSSEHGNLMIFCDIEGAEKDLLDINSCEVLKNIDIMVETHDFIIPELTELFISRFEKTHYIDIISDTPRNYMMYDLLKDIPLNMAHMILEEHRPVGMKWMRLTSKS